MSATSPEARFLIVSVDGGGIRGVVPALLLEDLHRTRRLRFDAIDLFAGTSTGSLIAVGLAAGVGIERIAQTYRDPRNCRRIFTPYSGSADGEHDRRDEGEHGGARRRGCLGLVLGVVERLLRGRTTGFLATVRHLLFPRYSSTGFEELIEELAPHTTIGALDRKVFVPSLCLDTRIDGHASWRPAAFHNLGTSGPGGVRAGLGADLDGHPDASIVDAVLASSAAPVDFAPHEYAGKLFVDGGMVANNPTAFALAAAKGAGLIGPAGVPLAHVYVLSLGTAASRTIYPPEDDVFPPPYGALGWLWPVARGAGGATPALPLASALGDAVTYAADEQVRMILQDANYLRVELSLGDDQVPMNDCGALPDLEARVADYMKTDEWTRAREWVGRHFG